MMRFTFTEQSAFFVDPNDPVYHLERAVDRLASLPPSQRLSVLYHDAKNYVDAGLTPYEAWYTPRIQAVCGYAALDWLALGQHLNRTSTTCGNLCTTIDRQLQTLVSSPTLSLPLFCSTLATMDHLWSILLPSFLEGINDPAVHTLLAYCGQSV